MKSPLITNDSREKEIVPYAEQEVGIFVTDTLIRKTDGKAIDLPWPPVPTR